MADPQYGIGDGQDNFAGAASNRCKGCRANRQECGEPGRHEGRRGYRESRNRRRKGRRGNRQGGIGNCCGNCGQAVPGVRRLPAVWSMRHTLFKVLVCICLAVVFLIVMVVSLPSIIFDSIFGSDSTPPVENATVTSVYADMSDSVSAIVESGYQQSMAPGGSDYRRRRI